MTGENTRIFSNLKTGALGVYHGLRKEHLQAYLDEVRLPLQPPPHPYAAFRTLLGVGSIIKPATYKMLIAAGLQG